MSRCVSSILAIFFLGLLVYSNTFFCSFHFDDDAYIVNCFAIRNIHHLLDIWNVCPCRFVTFLSLAFNYHFNHLNVFGYHLFNFAIHIGTALLVWWLCLLTFLTPTLKKEKISQSADVISLFTALIFVSHPVQIEAVTYIWQRAASMTAFFYLASLCFYIKSRLLENEKNESHKIYYAISIVVALLAVFTKENAITLPLMILLYEFVFLKTGKNIDWIHLYPFWIILFIIPQTMVMTRTSRLGEIQSIVSGPSGISPMEYMTTQFRVIITYMRLCILPVHLNLDYDYPIYKSFFEIPVVLSFVLIAGVLYGARQIFARYRIISFSIFWFFLTLLPESSLLPQTDVIFEHRLYLPLVGYCLLLSCGLYYLTPKKVMIGILSVVLAFNSLLTFERNKVWKNELTLWSDVVKKSPHKARPYINRGWAFYNRGDDKEANEDFDRAIQISPEFIYPYDDKGLIDAREGRMADAILEYNQSIKINPYYAKVYYHRGLAFLVEKNNSKAILDFNKAIELDPLYLDAYKARGTPADLLKAHQIDPDS